MQHAVRPRTILLPRRALLLFIAFILAAFLTLPAVAEYLGPDRTTTVFVEVRDPDHDVWTLTHVDPFDGLPDVCLIIHTCAEHPSVERQLALCGWVADPGASGCDEAYKTEEQTVLLPEATISGVLQNCSLVDGWCTSSPTLHLTAAEPVAGEYITVIEGTRNGEPFACSGVACDVPLIEGSNTFTFWALSTWGDSSQMGTFTALVDSLGPTLSIPDAWYIWEPLAVGVDDGGVGIDRVKLTIDGGSFGNRSYEWSLSNLPDDFIWDRHIGEVIAPIGEYPVTVQAWDLLGNSTSATGLILIPAPEEPEAAEGISGPVSEPAPAEAPEPTSAPIASALSVQPASTGEPLAALVEEPVASIESAESATTITSAEGGSGTLLWGAAALAAAASATAYALSRRQDRLAEVAAKRKEAAKAASAEGFNARLGRLRSTALTRVAPIRAGILAAAAAAARASQEIQERRKVQYRLSQNMARLERLGPPTTSMEQMVAWQSPDPELNETYQLGRMHSTLTGTGEFGITPGTETPSPLGYEPVQTGTPSPPGTLNQPTAVPIPTAPYSPGFVPNDPDLLEGKWIARGLGLTGSGVRAYAASAVQYTALEGGRIVISAPSLARGTRAEFLANYRLRGGPYSQPSLSAITRGGILRGAFTRTTIGVSLLTSLAGNLWDFGLGQYRGRGIVSTEFLASTVADVAMSLTAGVLAAGAVAGILAVTGATLPIWGTVAVTAVVGLGISATLDSFGVGRELKERVNSGLQAWPGILQNAGVIGQAIGERAGEFINNTEQAARTIATNVVHAAGSAAREVVQSVTDARDRMLQATNRAAGQVVDAARAATQTIANEVREVGSTVSSAVGEVTDTARQFLGRLFGGDD